MYHLINDAVSCVFWLFGEEALNGQAAISAFFVSFIFSAFFNFYCSYYVGSSPIY